MSTETKNDQPAEKPTAQTAEGTGGPKVHLEVHLAAEAVRLAKTELEKAEKMYNDVCRQAAEKIKAVRETTVGDVIDRSLVTVKRHPGPSLIISAALGFCLGRWVQKLFRK